MARTIAKVLVTAAFALATCLLAAGCLNGGGSGGGSTGGVWTIVSLTKYDVAGNVDETVVQELGADGSLQYSDWTYEDSSHRILTYDEFDEHGAGVHGTATRLDATGNVTRTEEVTNTNTYDADGRLLSSEDENGVIYEYSYHDNGVIAENHSNQGYENKFDERGRKVYYAGGFLGCDGRGACTVVYDEDARGNVTGWTATFENGETCTFTCTLDKHGNITDVYGANGQLLIHAEYQHIANPCDVALVYQYTRVGTWVVFDAVEQWVGI